MAAATGGDSDGDSEELVLTPAQLIHSLEQVPELSDRLGLGLRPSGGAVAVFFPLAGGGAVELRSARFH